MARPFRQQIDEGILDRAAALFAQRGFAKTSVQDIADAVGLSKAGLLHHFPSKDALHDAVLAHAAAMGQHVLDGVGDLPLGAERDRRVVELVVDVALAHPGVVALLLSPITHAQAPAQTDVTVHHDLAAPGPAGGAVLQAFGVVPEETETDRTVRVVGALGALAVLTIAAAQRDTTITWRPHIVATCLDALGHGRSSAPFLPAP